MDSWWDEIDAEIYYDYLNSKFWQELKEKVSADRNHKCEICGEPEGFMNTHEVHHTKYGYQVLGNIELIGPRFLKYVCQKCHKQIHCL